MFDLGIIYPSVGYTNEKIYIYLACNTIFEEQKLDEGEFLEVEYFDFATVLDMVDSNIIKDSKTIIAVLKAKEILKQI